MRHCRFFRPTIAVYLFHQSVSLSSSLPRLAQRSTKMSSATARRSRRLLSTSKEEGQGNPTKKLKKTGSPSKSKKKTPKKDQSNLEETETATHDPWYRVFTKGDEEYDRYMATEWGFEKVQLLQFEFDNVMSAFLYFFVV